MPVTVRAVASPEEFESFVGLVSRLHRDEPCWVPLLPEIYRRALSRDLNPYFRHADGEYLLAWRDGEVVGHVIAHIDHALNDYQGNRWGFFGFFEAEDDQEVATGLLGAAAAWLAERGRDRMVGPLQFTTRDDPGVLIEGNDRRPVVLQPWHPPYYRRLLEGAGLIKAKDVVWREMVLDDVPEDLLERGPKWAAMVQQRYGVTMRWPTEETLAADLERVFRFMPPMFESDWCYVPLPDDELRTGLAVVAPMLGPGTLMAELNGELIGASTLVPDYRQTIRNENGRPVRFDGKIDQARLMFTAVAPKYRHLMPALSSLQFDAAGRRGIKRIVIGWSYEDNQAMNVAMARLGLEVTRRHRIYEKELAPSSSPAPAGGADPATSE